MKVRNFLGSRTMLAATAAMVGTAAVFGAAYALTAHRYFAWVDITPARVIVAGVIVVAAALWLGVDEIRERRAAR